MHEEKMLFELHRRGLVETMSDPSLFKEPISYTTYVGFDPTATSLHIGNLVAIMVLAWFQRYGHQPIALIGGATGMIGDPSGTSKERVLLSQETIDCNLQGITYSLKKILGDQVIILNNYDWFAGISWIEFLRDIGRFFRMGTMLTKESVRNRLHSDVGLSFTEFSYQIMQAYDFLHLFEVHGVNMQIGGSDQWGNITAGIELIRKKRGATVYGMTFPLLTRSDGKKFGKTEEGTVWLNEDLLSPYDFYQYFMRIPDADVINLLKKLTFLEYEQIETLEKEMQSSQYHPNTAQQLLAETITEMVHGAEGLLTARQITEAARPGGHTTLNRSTFDALSNELPTIYLSHMIDRPLVDLLVEAEAQPSKSAAKRLIAGGGVYLNNQKIEHVEYVLRPEDLIQGESMIISIGKKKKIILRLRH